MRRVERPDRLALLGGDLDPPPLRRALDAPRREDLVLDESTKLCGGSVRWCIEVDEGKRKREAHLDPVREPDGDDSRLVAKERRKVELPQVVRVECLVA